MQRLELIIETVGKEPSVVPVTRTMIVGRSRRADLTVPDEEVGREQFRIVLDDTGAAIEGIGATNQTLVDGAVLGAGQRRRLASGTAIRVGRTTFTVRNAQPTEGARPGDAQDVTLVSPRPSGPAAPPPPTPRLDQTDGAGLRTMQGVRPGMRPPDETSAAQPRRPADPPKQVEPEQTMQLRGGAAYRPGQAAPPPAVPPATPPAAPPPAMDRTVAAPRPAPPSPPRATPPAEPDRTMPAGRPGAPPPRPAPSPAPATTAPPPAAPPEKTVRPTTIAVNPVDIAAEIEQVDLHGAKAVDVETRLHEMTPRLFVKCEGMKRRMRLMKARNMLGRAESVDVLLPNESVSEQHAEILFDGRTWMLRDRGSTNGTFVDGGHLRGGSQELVCHSIIGLGVVRAIFLCNDRRDVAGRRRLEERAVKLLVQAGRLQAEAGREAVRVARADPSQSIAELLLMDTPLLPAEWATAVTTARSQRSLLDHLKSLFGRLRRERRAPPKR